MRQAFKPLFLSVLIEVISRGLKIFKSKSFWGKPAHRGACATAYNAPSLKHSAVKSASVQDMS
jgi:hypothetical protein